MSVKDDADCVAQSIDSILQQEDIDFELIIVNDGSVDGTGDKLTEFQRADHRIKLIDQKHRGLTISLIAGCKLTQGKYIARQDGGGDLSLPDRLRKQYQILEDHKDAVMIGSGARFVGPAGEYLYDTVITQSELDRGLNSLRITNVRGPAHHCSTMIRKSAYTRIGGYRDAFYFAQDLDLWLRLYETGNTIADETIRYVARVRPKDISTSYRKNQIETAKLVLKAARLRRVGQCDNKVLDLARQLKHNKPRLNIVKTLENNNREAKSLYHIGSCINLTDSERARHYYQLALKKQPFHIRALLRFVSTYLN